VGGSLLYVWLLHAGGQPVIAQRLLADAETCMPDNPMVQAVQQQLRSGMPHASGPLLVLPTRLAPYSAMKGLPATARVVGSAVLLHGGTKALLPLSLLPASGCATQWASWCKPRPIKNSARWAWRWCTCRAGCTSRPTRWWPPVMRFREVRVSRWNTPHCQMPRLLGPCCVPGFWGSASGVTGERLLGLALPAVPRG
jgi:hypothetical protein